MNGHEWVKQRLREERIGFESLDNGCLSCALFMSKVFLRVLRPGSQSLQDDPDDIQRPLRRALAAVDAEIACMCDAAQLQPAA